MNTPPTNPGDGGADSHATNTKEADAGGRSALSILSDIQKGSLDPRILANPDRLRCVEHLTTEGYSASQVARVLTVSERTIARDRAAIRKTYAVERDPEKAAEMVGQLILQADTCIQRIRRVTRERDTPANTRVDGERACWVIFRDLIQRLQTLGYLPTAPHEIRGTLTHEIEQLPGFAQMNDEVARLEVIVKTHALGEESLPLLQKFAEVKDQVKRGALLEELDAIKTNLPSDGETTNESNDQRSTEGDAARDQRASTQGG